ncbi:hypothetical protein X286_08970 [Oenococcus oeni IOEB_9517]|nr:hypothetical protein AWRIB553_211 [Oenococcus oeni AWRIB553]KGH67486.1 hypothetical protein X286_08970 [Oenococcus oeni IOEB_9517]
MVLPPILNTVASDTHGFLILLTIYLIGSYIKRYNINVKTKWLISSMILSLILFYFSMILLYKAGVSFQRIDTFGYGLLPAIFTTSLFILIKQGKPFYSKTVNLIASNVFSVYLITVHPAIQSQIFTEVFNVKKFQDNLYLLLLGLGIAIFLVLLSCFIDMFRKYLFIFLAKLKFHFNLNKKSSGTIK